MVLLRFLLLGLSLVSLGLARHHHHEHHRGPARGKKELLFYGPSVGDEVDIAVALGYKVNVMTADEWAALTDHDVRTYRAIIFGDPTCTGGESILDAAVANRKMWSRHVKGNIVVMGTDPSYHWTNGNVAGAKSLVEKALKFVTSTKDKTGLYMTLSCYYAGSPATTVKVLDQFGTFGVVAATGCSNAAHVVSGGGVLDALTDAELSNWWCSVHEVIYEMPPEFAALAIATDSVGLGVGKYWDGTSGAPFIVARGVRVHRCGNGKKERGEECDDGNNRNGDGCSSVCKKERRHPHH